MNTTDLSRLINREWQYHLSTRVCFGSGRLDEVGQLAASLGRSVLLATYADRAGIGESIERACRSLRDAGLQLTLFDRATADPPAGLAESGAELARSCNCDVVVGLGGGSAIDLAKGIAALARSRETVWSHTKANPAFQPITQALPIVAVPTTAGTGSEVTNVAVFSHSGVGPDDDGDLKAAVFGDALCPTIALVDPDLTVGSPAMLTAACGSDALAHAIESMLSRNSNPISNMLAGKAIELLVEHLPLACTEPDDAARRRPVALASLLAGTAFCSTGVTVAHVLAHGLGGVLHMPHAIAVAIATPIGLRFNAETHADQVAALGRHLGLDNAPADQLAARVTREVAEFLGRLGLPAKAKCSAPKDGLEARLARNALLATPVAAANNPRAVDACAIEALFLELLSSE